MGNSVYSTCCIDNKILDTLSNDNRAMRRLKILL